MWKCCLEFCRCCWPSERPLRLWHPLRPAAPHSLFICFSSVSVPCRRLLIDCIVLHLSVYISPRGCQNRITASAVFLKCVHGTLLGRGFGFAGVTFWVKWWAMQLWECGLCKLHSYFNKINGSVRRNIGRNMWEEIKLRLQKLTAKSVLLFESKVFILGRKDKTRL
jgi:hypothetical protein